MLTAEVELDLLKRVETCPCLYFVYGYIYIYIYTVHVTNITAQIWVDMEIKQESLEGI